MLYERKIIFTLLPRRLVVKDEDGWRFVGWVWWQKALLVKNLNHGWIAFLDDQTEENLKLCPCCNKPVKE